MRRRWLVVAGTSGIGSALVRRLLADGHHVVATTREPAKLTGLRMQYPHRLIAEALDVTDPQRIDQVVKFAVNALGGLDAAVCSAGYALMGAAEELTDAQVVRQLETNLLGPIRVARAIMPFFRAQRSGWLVQISSEAGQTALPGLSLYHAGKWGAEGFYESLAQEVAAFGVHVSLICPGRTHTSFDSNAVVAPCMEDYRSTPAGHLRQLLTMRRFQQGQSPADIAAAIVNEATRDAPRRRLIVGADAWRHMQQALSARLTMVEAQRDDAATAAASSGGPPLAPDAGWSGDQGCLPG